MTGRPPLAFWMLAAALVLAPAAGMPVAAQSACPTATLKSARALAERAAAHLGKVGSARAFADFMNPAGSFMTGDLYVWVFDLDGVMVANGRYPHFVGSRVGLGGGPGSAIVSRALRENSGWVEYRWYSPCTRRLGPKIAWFVRVGRYVVGAGAYPKAGV